MDIRKLLGIFCVFFCISCDENPNAPIVNICRLENNEFFMVLNNERPKLISSVDSIKIDDTILDRYYYDDYADRLVVDEIHDSRSNLRCVILRSRGISENQLSSGEIHCIEIEGTRMKIRINAEYKNGIFKILAEEYYSYPEHHKRKRYYNAFDGA